jgi:hypothetical protein
VKAGKAIYGAAIGFLAPGAAYLLLNMGDGITGNEWLGALFTSIITAGSVGTAVFLSPKNAPADH